MGGAWNSSNPTTLSNSMKNSVGTGWSTVICVRKYVTVYTRLLWTHRLQNRFFRPSRNCCCIIKFSSSSYNKRWTIPARKNWPVARAQELAGCARARISWLRARMWYTAPLQPRKQIPPFQNECSLVHNIFKLLIIFCSQFQKHTLGNQLTNTTLRSLKALSYLATYTSLNAANVTLVFSLFCLLCPCVISVC